MVVQETTTQKLFFHIDNLMHEAQSVSVQVQFFFLLGILSFNSHMSVLSSCHATRHTSVDRWQSGRKWNTLLTHLAEDRYFCAECGHRNLRMPIIIRALLL